MPSRAVASCRCAAARSSGVLTLPSSGTLCSRSGTPLAITSLRGQLRPAAIASRALAADSGSYTAQSGSGSPSLVLRYAVDRLPRPPRRDQARERIIVDEGQVAREHQPRGLRMCRLRGERGRRSVRSAHARPRSAGRRRGPGRHAGRRGPRRRRARNAVRGAGTPSRAAGGRAARGPPCRVASACSIRRRAPDRRAAQVVSWASCPCRSGGAGQDAAARRPPMTLRLPPRFSISRVSAITMACESALHMS